MNYKPKNFRVLLPHVEVKSLKPLGPLLSPKSILITLLLVSLLSQVSDNLKNILSLKDVQKLQSVRIYIKAISSGISSASLCALLSLSKTLGPELETLSLLSPRERLYFLREIQKKIVNDKGPGKISFKNYKDTNDLGLAKHRKGISMQCRSLFISTAIFSSNSIIQGIPIKQINLDTIISSSKTFWVSMGLEEEDFEFLVKKEAYLVFLSKNLSVLFREPKTVSDALIILFYSELSYIFNFKKKLIFNDDDIIFNNNENNITLLEKELGFIIRLIPSFYNKVPASKIELNDSLIRMSFDQRKSQSSKYLKNF